MDAKHPKENQSQTLMVLVSNLIFGFHFGLILPLLTLMGCGSLSFFINYQLPSSDNAECKKTRFPVWFTAPAYILCCILVRISWTLLNDYCEKLLKDPIDDGFLVFVQIAFYSLGFTHLLVLALGFGFCTYEKIEEKSSISDIESVQSKS
ncbi:hypothetical protein QQP08_023641 [Theobroma cacao]|nr:hypothetical protein QQP08_023641 [Theobroma cacao]